MKQHQFLLLSLFLGVIIGLLMGISQELTRVYVFLGMAR